MTKGNKRLPTSPLDKILGLKKHIPDKRDIPDMSDHTAMLNSLIEGQKKSQGELLLIKSKLNQNQTNINNISTRCGQLESDAQYADSDLKELRDDFQDLKKRSDLDHAMITELKRQLDFANSKIKSLEARITSLSLDCKDKSMLINGLPELSSNSLNQQVFDLLRPLFPGLLHSDLDLVYRTGKQFPNQPRSVFVSFIRAADRRLIFANRDTLRDDDTTRNIYVNEDVPQELRGPRADMRAIAKLANETGHSAKTIGDKITIDNMTYRSNELHLLPEQFKLENVKIRPVPGGLAFQGKEAFLSNFYPAPFIMRGLKFCSAEQAYQFYHASCLNELEFSQAILKTDDPEKARSTGNHLPPTVKWDAQKDEKMFLIVLNKFLQNKDLARKLVNTGTCQLYEATRCPYWAAGITLGAREWARGFIPGQNRLGNILMKVREELFPFYQESYKPTSDQQPSPAEALALGSQLLTCSNSASASPDKISPLPPPHIIKQMVSMPPPVVTTSNKYQALSITGVDDDVLAATVPLQSTLQAAAAKIKPTIVPQLPSVQDASLDNNSSPMDIGLDPVLPSQTADRSNSGTQTTVRPISGTQTADQIDLHTNDDQSTINVTSRRTRKQPQPTRVPDHNDQNNPENDFTFTCYQLGLSPQSAPTEITASRSKSLRERIGAALKRLSV